MEERATAYSALFYRGMQIEGVFPDNQTMRVIILRHTDAQWKDDLSDLPEVCRQESPPLDSPTAVVERIAEIPNKPPDMLCWGCSVDVGNQVFSRSAGVFRVSQISSTCFFPAEAFPCVMLNRPKG
jgi:hypothetical protein